MLRTLDLLASDSSHLPFLYVFKESEVMEKYGFEIDLHIVGGAKAPTMAHRAKLALAGEIDFLSGLHHETYRERAKGEKRLTYLAQAQNNWDDRLVALPTINGVQDLKSKKIVCHAKAPCVAGNLRAVLETCGLKPEEIYIDVVEDSSGKFLQFVDHLTSGEAVAALVDMPFDLYGVKKGLKIVDLPDRPMIHNTTLLATTDYIKQNEETVYAFIKGFRSEIYIDVVEDSSGKFLQFVDHLTSGEAVAALVDMPFDLYGVKKGLKIVDLPDRPVIHNTTLLATTDYIKQNEETVYAFIKGFIEALHFFKTQPDKVIPILKKNLAKRYGLEDDEYYIHLQREWAKLLSKKPYPLANAIQNVYDLDVGKDPAMRSIGPMEPWDLHYISAIDDSGFIDNLYAL